MRKKGFIFIQLLVMAALLAWAGSARAVSSPANKRNTFTLVIDAGHGGKDPGARGRFSKEKDINLAVAKAFGKLVEDNCPDVKVIYTRKTDVFIPLGKRADIANKAQADLFVSIHTNALPGKAIGRGAETYTLGMARASENLEVAKRENAVILVESDYKERYQGFDPNSAESYIIFELMQDKNMEKSVNLARHIQREFRNTGGRPDKGVHQAGFLVLRETSMPSVLIELGYISTHDEETFLNSQNGIRKMSRSIYNAFLSYRKANGKGKAKPAPATARQEEPEAPAPQAPEATDPQPDGREQAQAPAQPEPAAQATDDAPVFKVQLMASTRQIPAGSSRFKGLSPIDSYQEGGYHKYTYGSTTDYNAILQLNRKVAEKFPGAFIIAFRNGQKIDTKTAIAAYRKNKQKR